MSKNINKLIGTRIADRYSIVGEIGVGGMGRVFRAMPFDDPSRDVAIKVIMRDRELNSEDVLRFQKEAALMSRLHHPNIICFHELGLLHSGDEESESIGSGYYIVMEIANGTNLKVSLEQDGRKDLAFFFQVGLRITDALDYTHGKNIIHRDIKPQNIVVGKAMQEQGLVVKVLDFGVARLAEAMHYTSADGQQKAYNDIAGTPLYMAPEQTPLLDASIDHRVDLYSLGCVLYEILAGRPPFSASTREKLERQHVFDAPEPLTNLRPDIPPVIEQIVHKLLSKHPNDRYQSAFAVHSDLLKAKTRLENKERPSSIVFPLGLNDRFQAVSAQLPLVGREQEFQQLKDDFEATDQERGRSRMTVVRGSAGIGKSRLLGEMRNFLSKRRMRFISANFSQHENTLPFNALANGFNDFLLRVLKSQPHEAEELKRKVRTLLGPTALQVANVVPGLMPFISQDFDNAELNDEDDFQTFSKAFSDFTRCLSVDGQSVVFIFDDLHWADDKSLDLIDQFFSHNNSQRFFMIVGYRTDDPLISPRFHSFIDKFRKLRRRFQEIELSAFGNNSVEELVGNMLAAKDAVSPDLVAYMQKNANGNPMHIVETVRSLVAGNLVSLERRNGGWQYDMKEIYSTPLRYQSIDLVLSRIQSFQEHDRRVLEIGATVGLTFQFELLLISDNADVAKTASALQRAINEGLIYRVPDDRSFRELGKSYSFSHWRARDIIYQNIDESRRRKLHRSIADRYEELLPDMKGKAVFALAHHSNIAVGGQKADSEQIALRCVESNIVAGTEAMRAESWQSAQSYFDSAIRQMDHWPKSGRIIRDRNLVVEKLADIAAHQRHHAEAVKRYRELWEVAKDDRSRSALAYKILLFQTIGGIVSQSLARLSSYSNSLGMLLPSGSLMNWLFARFTLLVDLLPVKPKSHRLFRLLEKAYVIGKAERGSAGRSNRKMALYHIGQVLHLHHRPELAFQFHSYLLAAALRGKVDSETMLRVIGDRAVLLAYLGFDRIGYQILDYCIDVAKGLDHRATYGYLHIMRASVPDYLKDRDDDVNRHLRRGMRHLSSEQDRLWYSLGLELRIFRELSKGKILRAIGYSRAVPESIPTRNWLSPRAFAIAFYAHLLNDARDALVHRGEVYLKRRERVSGRENDMFVLIIRSLVAFARGDVENTRTLYSQAVSYYVATPRMGFLYPFEEDFIGLYALSLPMLFQHEHGRHLLRGSELRHVTERLSNRVRSIKGENRGLKLLLRARAHEILGRSDVKRLYDEAIKSAKISSSQLVLAFAYLWFGDYLVRNGAKARGDYLKKGYRVGVKNELYALAKYAEKLMTKRGIDFRPVEVGEPKKQFVKRAGSYRSNLVFEHLGHIGDVIHLDTALEQNLDESLAILKREYHCENVYCILTASDSVDGLEMFYPFHKVGKAEQVKAYVHPYISIRSTLFLPHSDAPWVSGRVRDVEAPLTRLGQTDPQFASGVDDETVALKPVPAADANDGDETLADTLAVSAKESEANLPARSLQMSALLPIKNGRENVGLLFLEDIDLTNRDTTDCRNELDAFGSQLGQLVESKRPDLVSQAVMKYDPGKYHIEPCSWLKIWPYGKLRSGRESTWYLGLDLGHANYLMVYVRLNGKEHLRDRASRVLWHQVCSIRSTLVSSGRGDYQVGEVRDEIAACLRSFPKMLELDVMSISFTIFNRDKQSAASGHFGSSRPLVLCQPNHVTPDNRVVMTLSNGRDLRFWSVESSMKGPHAYILAHDTSRLDMNLDATQRRSLMTSLQDTDSRRDLHQIIERIVMRENIPRYYLGVVMPGVVGHEDEELEQGA